MPLVIAWLGELIITNVGAWIVSALLTIGIGFAAHAAAPAVLSAVPIFSKFQEAGPLWNWVGFLNIDTDITIVLSAWAGRTITDALKVHLAALPKKSA